MKKTIIILALMFASGNPALAGNDNESKADSLRTAGNLTEALVYYSLEYQTNPGNIRNLYDYACALSLLNWNDSAFKYLQLYLPHDTSVRVLTDPDFYFLTQDDRWKEIEDAMVRQVEAKFGPYEKPELARELWRMKVYDQAFYYHIQVAETQLGRNSPVVHGLWELKRKLNHRNLERLEEIIEENGWPTISQVKGNAAGAVFLIIQHAELETQQKYLPMLRAAADSGEASWSSLALLIDRVNLREGKPQIYGSQITMNEDGSYAVDDLVEPEYVNQRRKEVGLGPIEDYVAHWGIEWTVEQKEK